MKVFQINSVPYGSTGKIMLGIDNVLKSNGFSSKMACGYSYHPINELKGKYIKIGNPLDKLVHINLTKLTGKHCVFSTMATKKLIREIKKFKPDVLHLHNLHSGFINLKLLFKFIKKEDVKVVWTLHDCWAFTGHCMYFTMCGCEKWKKGCYDCSQHKSYPKTFIDKSNKMYELKKSWFTGVKNMQIVTPSAWLKDLVEASFLKEYPVKVINNGIDLDAFKPYKSDLKEKLGVKNKKIVLGVSFCWDKRKGIDRVIELSQKLSNEYKIILVGTDEKVDKILPNGIISIHRTQNQKELAEIYSIADVFFNPTREDNFPTVNIEALACDTPVVTFKTGGSPESITKDCGFIVESTDEAISVIKKVCEENAILKNACRERANDFNMHEKFTEYLEIYKNI